jgi:hypothetical protein
MTTKKIIPVVLVFIMLALTACSSTSGGGATQPSDVNVVVPPSTNVVVPPSTNVIVRPSRTVVVPPNSTVVSP